jgi:hypothetical protein
MSVALHLTAFENLSGAAHMLYHLKDAPINPSLEPSTTVLVDDFRLFDPHQIRWVLRVCYRGSLLSPTAATHERAYSNSLGEVAMREGGNEGDLDEELIIASIGASHAGAQGFLTMLSMWRGRYR